MLHATLWEANRDLAEQCLRHPFVRGLADGTLDEEAFKRYVAQDAFFLRSFLAAYALAAARCAHDTAAVAVFHRLIGGVLEELELHAAYARDLDIDLERVRPFPETSAYTDFLLRVAWTGEPAETVAAMTPCMRLYAFLGARLAEDPRPETRYREWIAAYSTPDFEHLAADLESLLDRLAEDSLPIRQAYAYAMACELDFFSAPLRALP